MLPSRPDAAAVELKTVPQCTTHGSGNVNREESCFLDKADRKRDRSSGRVLHELRCSALRDRQEIADLFILAQQLLPEVVPACYVLTISQCAFDPIVPIFEPQIENAGALFQPRAILRGSDRLSYYSSRSGHDVYTNPVILETPLRNGVRGFASLLQTLDQGGRITPSQLVDRLTEHLL